MERLLLIGLMVWQAAWAQSTPADPPAQSETDRLIESLRAQVKKAPAGYAGYDALGAAFLQKARETGSVDYYDLAEKNIAKAISLSPPGFQAADPLVHLAMVYMGEHRFTEALATSKKAIGLGSGNLAAFAIEGDAYTDLGEYEDAATAYGTLAAIGKTAASPHQVAYMLDSRLSYLSFLKGDTAGAIRLLESCIQAALVTQEPRENLAWLYYELGERLFQSGDLTKAGLSYSAGIQADPVHYRALAGLAKVRAAQGKLDESIDLYKRSIAVVPFPVYVAELGDVYRLAGRPKDAQREYDLVEFIGRLSKLSQVLANRELAMFYADREIKLAEAVDLARHELDVRHDVYTYDTLAWALCRNKRYEEAAAAMDKALRLNTEDPLMLFHAGMIYRGLGKESQAQAFLERALKTNPHFHIFYAGEAARTLEAMSREPGREAAGASR